MPAPDKEWWSTDYYLYTYVYQPMSYQMCMIPPNIITGLSFAMTFPIIHALIELKSLPALLFYIFIRQSFDCLDGAVARTCGTGTKVGAYLDIWSDIAAGVLFLTAILYALLHTDRLVLAGCVGGIGIYVLYNMITMAMKEMRDVRAIQPYRSELDKVLNNNTVLLMMLGAVAVHFMIHG
jgi:phosphatidylglycerophosphate synthase